MYDSEDSLELNQRGGNHSFTSRVEAQKLTLRLMCPGGDAMRQWEYAMWVAICSQLIVVRVLCFVETFRLLQLTVSKID